MSKTAGHTATPWEVRHNEDGYPCIGYSIYFIADRIWSTDFPAKESDMAGRRKNKEQAEANAHLIVTAVNSHASNLRKVEALRDALRKIVDHGYCPNCGCDLWNTKGCPTCPAMRSAYDALVELGEKPPRVYAEYMDADPANKLNMGMLTVVTDYINALSDSRIHNGQKERLELAEQTLRHAAERALALAEEQL